MTRPQRVIKLGGSLLEFDQLVPHLRHWLAAQPPMDNVILVGGGRLADAIRDAYSLHALSEEAAHWLCIRILNVTAELLARLMPEAVLINEIDVLLEQSDGEVPRIFEPERFLRDEASWWEKIRSGKTSRLPADSVGLRCAAKASADPVPLPLPHSWDVTSDSIAARLAVFLQADELVLLKSSVPMHSITLPDAADTGYVDRYFPLAAAGLRRIRCVNLRDDGFGEIAVQV